MTGFGDDTVFRKGLNSFFNSQHQKYVHKYTPPTPNKLRPNCQRWSMTDNCHNLFHILSWVTCAIMAGQKIYKLVLK